MELSDRVSTLGFCFRCFIPTCYLISSHNYATKVSKNSTAFINVLLSQPISHLDESVQQEILLFIEQARDTKQDVTAYGFFTVNNKTIIGHIMIVFCRQV
ncbi:uncharacterized protein LOC142320842 isoform X2 [Lycorma delicatula]|uniref:uncharacterized protein LOC142320842 isoform X2 n=1 Tax=Lycorma delicatula TaxID=130591 RepID=UPI003F519608